jgi:HAE1 family hydrophobic/amphiphilic exporter-1
LDNGLLHAVKRAVYIQQAITIRRRNLIFTNSNGETFALSQFAVVNEGLGESVLQRIDRLGSITVNANVAERPTGILADEINAKAANIKLP